MAICTRGAEDLHDLTRVSDGRDVRFARLVLNFFCRVSRRPSSVNRMVNQNRRLAVRANPKTPALGPINSSIYRCASGSARSADRADQRHDHRTPDDGTNPWTNLAPSSQATVLATTSRREMRATPTTATTRSDTLATRCTLLHERQVSYASTIQRPHVHVLYYLVRSINY